MALAGTQSANTFEAFLTQLRESHEVSVYEAIERLVQAGEAGIVGVCQIGLLAATAL